MRMASVPMRLALSGALLLVGAALALATASHALTEERRDAELRLLAESSGALLAARISQALQAGVPLDRLHGVEALFEQRLRDVPQLSEIALRSAERELYRAGAVADPGAARARVPLPAVSGVALELSWQPPRERIVAAAALQVVAALLGLALLAGELAHHAWLSGPALRRRVLDRQAELIVAGCLDRTVLNARRRSFDARPQHLLLRLRNVVDLHSRLQRLIASLRSTEPDRNRRERLDQLAQAARGADVFAVGDPLLVRLDARNAGRDLASALLAAAGGLLMTAGAVLHEAAFALQPLVLALSGVLALVVALRCRPWPALRGAPAGLLLAPAIAALGGGAVTALAALLLAAPAGWLLALRSETAQDQAEG
jgi:hypothetical protein